MPLYNCIFGVNMRSARYMKYMNKRRVTALENSSGFTLLEILVAVSVLGIAVVVVFQLFSANLNAIAASEDYVSATIMANAKMREILDEDKLEEGQWSETTADNYRIEASAYKVFEDRTENLHVELLEISLTLHWTKGAKERQLTLTTLKTVDKRL